jgi:chemotaxis protein methyltransferase WspC
VDGVDISARRLDFARTGVFSESAFRGNDRTVRDRYFQKRDQGFELDTEIRSRVRFIQGSALDAALLEREPPYDVIFCRNLLIYLDAAARKRLLENLDRLLAAEGILLIGHADRFSQDEIDTRFALVGEPRAAFAYSRAPKPNDTTTTLPLVQPQLSGSLPLAGKWASTLRDRDVPAGQQMAPEPRQTAGSRLDRATQLANLGRSDEAITLCQQVLRLQGPSPVVYFLMGVIYQSIGDRALGEECFHKTVYLDPGHDEALLALALSAERRGDTSAAAGFRRRAERALKRRGAR